MDLNCYLRNCCTRHLKLCHLLNMPYCYLTPITHSVNAVSTLYLSLISLPRVLKAVHSSRSATRASPFPALTTRSPALPVPVNLTKTRPFNAIMGCESLFPACAFIKNAGDSETTPKTASESSSLHLVISAFPPK